MFDRTITLYNYKKSDHLWRGVVIPHCTLSVTEATGDYSQSGGQDRLTLSLRCNRTRDIKTLAGTVRYAMPLEYQAKTSVTGFFTITPEADFIVIGERTDLLVDDLSATYPNGFYHYMNRNVDDVFLITDQTYFSLIPHFTISGR